MGAGADCRWRWLRCDELAWTEWGGSEWWADCGGGGGMISGRMGGLCCPRRDRSRRDDSRREWVGRSGTDRFAVRGREAESDGPSSSPSRSSQSWSGNESEYGVCGVWAGNCEWCGECAERWERCEYCDGWYESAGWPYGTLTPLLPVSSSDSDDSEDPLVVDVWSIVMLILGRA